jgi:hypothetical protein
MSNYNNVIAYEQNLINFILGFFLGVSRVLGPAWAPLSRGGT